MTEGNQFLKELREKTEKFKQLPLSEKLPITVNKMVNIVKGRTGGSEIYAQMLLSMLPNTSHKVCINYWCYKADSDDFQTMLELMQDNSMIWEYEKLIQPHVQELINYLQE